MDVGGDTDMDDTVDETEGEVNDPKTEAIQLRRAAAQWWREARGHHKRGDIVSAADAIAFHNERLRQAAALDPVGERRSRRRHLVGDLDLADARATAVYLQQAAEVCANCIARFVRVRHENSRWEVTYNIDMLKRILRTLEVLDKEIESPRRY